MNSWRREEFHAACEASQQAHLSVEKHMWGERKNEREGEEEKKRNKQTKCRGEEEEEEEKEKEKKNGRRYKADLESSYVVCSQ